MPCAGRSVARHPWCAGWLRPANYVARHHSHSLLAGLAQSRPCFRATFSLRQPLVELLTGLLFVTCLAEFPPGVAACGAVFLSALVAAAFVDFDHFIIPDVFTVGLAIAGVILSAAVPALHEHDSGTLLLDSLRAGFASVVGVLVGSAVVLWIGLIGETVRRKEAVGFGDVKFVGAIGAFCGWQGAVLSVFGGSVVFVAWFGAAWVWKRISGRRAAFALPSETSEGEPADPAFGLHTPFGPMLAIAAALYFIVFRSWFNGSFAELAFPGGRG